MIIRIQKLVSVNAEDQGMEYPMICWNFGRPGPDGKTEDKTKNGMMGVIVHEVGHNFFPMIVNSDERQWTWMDEGLNSFMEYMALMEWDPNFPADRGPAKNIIPYMSGDQKGLEPIMTNSESYSSIWQQCLWKTSSRIKYSSRNHNGTRIIRLCL